MVLFRDGNIVDVKLDGLSEYNIRRPMVPTGTNLLGLIKHVASVELGYFGDCFGRPFGEPMPWIADDAEPNADMWATADESRELPAPVSYYDLHKQAIEHYARLAYGNAYALRFGSLCGPSPNVRLDLLLNSMVWSAINPVEAFKSLPEGGGSGLEDSRWGA